MFGQGSMSTVIWTVPWPSSMVEKLADYESNGQLKKKKK